MSLLVLYIKELIGLDNNHYSKNPPVQEPTKKNQVLERAHNLKLKENVIDQLDETNKQKKK